MARLATSAAHFCQRLQELYPQKLALSNKHSEQSSPFRRWTTGSGAGSSYRQHDPRATTASQTNMTEGSPGPARAAPAARCWKPGGVARWSLGLDLLLSDPVGVAAFTHFLSKEFATENIRFWWACEQYKKCEDPERRRVVANEIWDRHLSERAAEPVNIDSAARKATQVKLRMTPAPQDLFQLAQEQIFNVMKFDSYPRFLRSTIHGDFARADLCGVPPSYTVDAPDGTTIIYPEPAIQSTSKSQDSSTRLKKSSSNVSERRRSASSLLPWRVRGASRDRAQAAPAPASASASASAPGPSTSAQHDAPMPTDVVRASQTPGSSLCRVILPDGATSVVEVDFNVTVRRLVDRLLQRRNLICNAYDVIVKDQGECRIIDSNSSSLSLGGREAVVERRIVVRLEVGSRCVAVRCGAARRLRHVLRPVLARYCGDQARAVCRDGVLVHPDTSMQELDGARLQVVELTEGGELVREKPREDDADSLSDLALRIQDDKDDQSSNSMSRSEVSSIGSGSVGGSGLPSGRVRAALRPGPPLHHHPPDFLENLRETQRQRLQNKSEPTAPRTPPPLPPKPPQRQAPSVV